MDWRSLFSTGMLLVLLARPGNATDCGPLFPGPAFGVGLEPAAVVIDELNGDGVADLVVVNRGTYSGSHRDSVSVLLGRGDGTFQPHTEYLVENEPAAVDVGDLNRDGHADIVVVNRSSNSLSLLFGRGDGTFDPSFEFDAGQCPRDVVIADLNADRKLDLAVANCAGEYVTTVENSTRDLVHVPRRPGDELRLLPPKAIVVLLGNGDGTFAPPTTYAACAANQMPWRIEAADTNGDQHLDLVVRNLHGDEISLLLGSRDGMFAGPQNYSVSAFIGNVIGAEAGTGFRFEDFNHDGRFDLALIDSFQAAATLFTSERDGSFAPWAQVPATQLSGSWALGLVDANTVPDVARLTARGRNVEVTLNPGQYAPAERIDRSSCGRKFDLADLDGDGLVEIVAASHCYAIEVLRSLDDGTFAQTLTIGKSMDVSPQSDPRVADVNRDGLFDFVVGIRFELTGSGGVRTYVQQPNGSFGEPIDTNTDFIPQHLRVRDINSDKLPDVIAVDFEDAYVYVGRGKGDGTFSAPQAYHVGANPRVFAIGDYVGDAAFDLAVPVLREHAVKVLPGRIDGTFGEATSYEVSLFPTYVTGGDVNGDTLGDLIVTNSGGYSPHRDESVSVLINLGDGSFTPPTDYLVGDRPLETAIGDLNDDQIPDLAVVNEGNESVSVLLGLGDGTFIRHADYVVRDDASRIGVGDFNHDGSLDIITIGQFGGYTLLLNQRPWLVDCDGDNSFSASDLHGLADCMLGPMSSSAPECQCLDLNRDGGVDLCDLTLLQRRSMSH